MARGESPLSLLVNRRPPPVQGLDTAIEALAYFQLPRGEREKMSEAIPPTATLLEMPNELV